MDILLATASLFIGLIFGSFLSVLFHRLEIEPTTGRPTSRRGKKTDWRALLGGRSRCDHCHKQLTWADNVPLLSFVMLRGKCRHCGTTISTYHPLLELVSGLTVLAAFLAFGVSWQFALAAFFGLATVFIFAYDLKHQIIPDVVLMPAIVVAFGVIVLQQIFQTTGVNTILMLLPVSPLEALLGGLVVGGFFLVLGIVSNGAWIGGGDIKLGFLIGLILGWPYALIALFLAYLIGTAYAVTLLIGKHAEMKTMIAFGPMLVAGFLIVLYYGEPILNWYQGVNI